MSRLARVPEQQVSEFCFYGNNQSAVSRLGLSRFSWAVCRQIPEVETEGECWGGGDIEDIYPVVLATTTREMCIAREPAKLY